jgi:hypothetical protein
MFVEVVAIEQRMSLQTKKTQNYLRLRMPNADELIVEVPVDDVMRLLRADQDGTTEPSKTAEVAVDRISIAEPPIMEEPIHWRDLTDEVLPATVKEAFERIGLPEVMTVAQITSYAHRVMEALSETQGEQQEEPAPPVGKVVPIRPEPDVDDVTGIPQV